MLSPDKKNRLSWQLNQNAQKGEAHVASFDTGTIKSRRQTRMVSARGRAKLLSHHVHISNHLQWKLANHPRVVEHPQKMTPHLSSALWVWGGDCTKLVSSSCGD